MDLNGTNWTEGRVKEARKMGERSMNESGEKRVKMRLSFLERMKKGGDFVSSSEEE